MKCKYCGMELSDNAKFCTKCGKKQEEENAQKQEPLFCKKCGGKLKPGARFCTSCGAEVMHSDVKTIYPVEQKKSEKVVKEVTKQEKDMQPLPSEKGSDMNVMDEAMDAGKEKNTTKIIIIVAVIAVIAILLAIGTVVIYNQWSKTPQTVEKQEEDEERTSAEKKDASEVASTEEITTEVDTEVDLSKVDFDLTKKDVLTLEGNVLESVSEGKVIKLAKPVKFYGVDESGKKTLAEDIGSVIIDGEKMPKGMLENIDGNTEVKASGKVSINDGKVYILVETMQDTKGKDMIAQFEKGGDEDYILPNSSDEYLTEEDIEDLSLQEVNYAKNEIYARHGRKFDAKELRDYFESKDWYKGTIDPADFDEYSLSKIERANVKLLKDREFSIDSKGYQLY